MKGIIHVVFKKKLNYNMLSLAQVSQQTIFLVEVLVPKIWFVFFSPYTCPHALCHWPFIIALWDRKTIIPFDRWEIMTCPRLNDLPGSLEAFLKAEPRLELGSSDVSPLSNYPVLGRSALGAAGRVWTRPVQETDVNELTQQLPLG